MRQFYVRLNVFSEMPVQSSHAQSLDRIEAELNSVLEQDSRYWRENDAKFRAVAQNATYEQFEEIVKASHLKPLDKEDKTPVGKPKQTIWNSVTNSSKPVSNSIESLGDFQNASLIEPKTVKDFQVGWNATEPESRWRYLESLGIAKLKNILVTEVPSELTVDLVNICLKESRVNDNAFVLKLLKVLTETKRFSLNIQFLSEPEKQAVCLLINRLKEWSKDSPHEYNSIENISKLFDCVQ